MPAIFSPRIISFAAVLVYSNLIPSGVCADAVADWNAIAVQAALTTAVPPRPGPSAILDLAMVHAAVYNAVEAIDQRFQPYLITMPKVSGSPIAATARAARDVLINRFPDQAAVLDKTYHDYLSQKGLTESDAGIAAGLQAAAQMSILRA